MTLISVQIAKAKGTLEMVQAQLPNMPKPISPNYRPTVEYVIEPMDSSYDGFRIATNDGQVIAIFSPMGETAIIQENNVLLVLAMVETFNTLQAEIMRGE